MVTGAGPGDRENGFGRSRLQLARRQFDLRLGLRRSRDGRLILVRLLRGAIPNDPVPDREKRRLADPARSRRMVAVDHKGIERAEEQSWQVTAARRKSSTSRRTIFLSCSSTRLATAVSSPRSIARSNSRISSACDCIGSCARYSLNRSFDVWLMRPVMPTLPRGRQERPAVPVKPHHKCRRVKKSLSEKSAGSVG